MRSILYGRLIIKVSLNCKIKLHFVAKSTLNTYKQTRFLLAIGFYVPFIYDYLQHPNWQSFKRYYSFFLYLIQYEHNVDIFLCLTSEDFYKKKNKIKIDHLR